MPYKKSAFEVIASARKTLKPETHVGVQRRARERPTTTASTTPEKHAASLSSSPLHAPGNEKPDMAKKTISECRPDTIPTSPSTVSRHVAMLSDKKPVKAAPRQASVSDNASGRAAVSTTKAQNNVKPLINPQVMAKPVVSQPLRTDSAKQGTPPASPRQVAGLKPTPASQQKSVESSKLPSREIYQAPIPVPPNTLTHTAPGKVASGIAPASATKQADHIMPLATPQVVITKVSHSLRANLTKQGTPDTGASPRLVKALKSTSASEDNVGESPKLPSREIDQAPIRIPHKTLTHKATDTIANAALQARPAKQHRPETQISSPGMASSNGKANVFRPLSEREAKRSIQRKPAIAPINGLNRSAFERIPPTRPIASSPPLSEIVTRTLSSEPSPYCSIETPMSPEKTQAMPNYRELPNAGYAAFDASSPEALAAMSAAYMSDLAQMQAQLPNFKPAARNLSPSTWEQAPTKSKYQPLDASSPEALAAMTAAFMQDQGYTPSNKSNGQQNNQFSRYPEKPKSIGPSKAYGNQIPTKTYHHRVVDLGSLHGNKFSAFLICAVCEILHFLYTSTPSSYLRLINLLLAVSLYSGVFDTHVQRAPLGMMLNRLAAWILALLALSTSVYASPEARWQLGEMRLLSLVGTFLFPLALLDSINVLRSEIRCRNFILKGFVVECLYVYCCILGVPVARLLLTDDAAAALCERYPVPETIYIVSIFSALVVAIEYFFVCQVAAGNFSKEFWQGMTSMLWGFVHAPGCALLVGKLNGIKAGGYVYVGSFVIFLIGRLVEPLLEEIGLLRYRETSTSPPTKKLE